MAANRTRENLAAHRSDRSDESLMWKRLIVAMPQFTRSMVSWITLANYISNSRRSLPSFRLTASITFFFLSADRMSSPSKYTKLLPLG